MSVQQFRWAIETDFLLNVCVYACLLRRYIDALLAYYARATRYFGAEYAINSLHHEKIILEILVLFPL